MGSRWSVWPIAATIGVASCVGGGTPRVAPDVDFDPSALIDVLPPDAIRAIDEPSFQPAADAAWLSPRAPVLALELDGVARAYPLGILTRHEIVNDVVAGAPVAVTYCPLCNSAVVYARDVVGRTLTFGVSGKLYHSDLVMFDRETESLWPQIQGVAVRGELRGTELVPVASSIVSFADLRVRFPDANVLVRPSTDIDYDLNPYEGYDTRDEPDPSFFAAEVDERLPAMARVVGVARGSVAIAYPYDVLQDRRVICDTVGGEEVVVLWGGDAASALDDASISEGRTVGATGVFRPSSAGRALTFVLRDDVIVDEQTGSTWSHAGIATGGPLEGETLQPVHQLDAFWFAWAAFVPHTELWSGPRG